MRLPVKKIGSWTKIKIKLKWRIDYLATSWISNVKLLNCYNCNNRRQSGEKLHIKCHLLVIDLGITRKNSFIRFKPEKLGKVRPISSGLWISSQENLSRLDFSVCPRKDWTADGPQRRVPLSFELVVAVPRRIDPAAAAKDWTSVHQTSVFQQLL